MAEFQCNEIEIKPGIQINSLSNKKHFKNKDSKTYKWRIETIIYIMII